MATGPGRSLFEVGQLPLREVRLSPPLLNEDLVAIVKSLTNPDEDATEEPQKSVLALCEENVRLSPKKNRCCAKCVGLDETMFPRLAVHSLHRPPPGC